LPYIESNITFNNISYKEHKENRIDIELVIQLINRFIGNSIISSSYIGKNDVFVNCTINLIFHVYYRTFIKDDIHGLSRAFSYTLFIFDKLFNFYMIHICEYYFILTNTITRNRKSSRFSNKILNIRLLAII